MALLIVAVCLLALLSFAHLLVTLAVVRRLREHATLLIERSAGGAGDTIAKAGTVVGEFTATSTDGRPLGNDGLAERTLVGFFSPGCAPCRDAVPRFLDAARGVEYGRDSVLAVVVGEPAEAAEHAEALAPVATVVIEPPDGPVGTAFGVTGYPALAVVAADGTILASGITLDDLASATVAA